MKEDRVVTTRRLLSLALAGAVLSAAQAARAQAPKPPVRTYDSPYYVIHTDLDPNAVPEIAAHLTAMGEAYYERTRPFAGEVTSKFQFTLLQLESDFLASGGLAGNTVTPLGTRLLAWGKTLEQVPWYGIQSMGFEQFARRSGVGRIPQWTERGMCVYFGHALWTGDGMTAGTVPAFRLKRLREYLAKNDLLTPRQIIELPFADWFTQRKERNHDQAWSMVHYLMHAEGGKHAPVLWDYIKDTAGPRRANPWEAFAGRFGADGKAFDEAYRAWWKALPDDSSAGLKAEAAVATLTSFLARAHALKMKFATAEEFFQAARDGKIKLDWTKDPTMWLPDSLLTGALKGADRLGTWSLDVKKPLPVLVLTDSGGATFTGTFTLPPNRHPAVKVERKEPKTKPASQPASGR